MRNCLLRAISHFPTVFLKFVLQTCKNQDLFGKGLRQSAKSIDSCQLAQYAQTKTFCILNLVCVKGQNYTLSHNNPCFQCNTAVTNFLISSTCEIRCHDVIGQSTVPMYSYAKILKHG